MKFLRKLLEPSYSRQADFNSLIDGPADYRFHCSYCSSTISFPFTKAISQCWGWEDGFDPSTVDGIKKYFEMNTVGKSPDGGWPSVFEVRCTGCQFRFMIYAGVEETSNSVYQVAIQSIAEISETE